MDQKTQEAQIDPSKVRYHVAHDLEYKYRDIFNIYAGVGDVVIEMGNQHRASPEDVTISDRIVLTVSNAYKLKQVLEQALDNAQKKFQESLNNQ